MTRFDTICSAASLALSAAQFHCMGLSGSSFEHQQVSNDFGLTDGIASFGNENNYFLEGTSSKVAGPDTPGTTRKPGPPGSYQLFGFKELKKIGFGSSNMRKPSQVKKAASPPSTPPVSDGGSGTNGNTSPMLLTGTKDPSRQTADAAEDGGLRSGSNREMATPQGFPIPPPRRSLKQQKPVPAPRRLKQ